MAFKSDIYSTNKASIDPMSHIKHIIQAQAQIIVFKILLTANKKVARC